MKNESQDISMKLEEMNEVLKEKDLKIGNLEEQIQSMQSSLMNLLEDLHKSK